MGQCLGQDSRAQSRGLWTAKKEAQKRHSPVIITTEPFDDSALRLEFEQITKSIADKQNQLELRQISAYEYEEFVKDEAETLKIIMMALELDSAIILQIIT